MPSIIKVVTYLDIVKSPKDELVVQPFIRDRNDIYYVESRLYDDYTMGIHFAYKIKEVNCNEDFDW